MDPLHPHRYFQKGKTNFLGELKFLLSSAHQGSSGCPYTAGSCRSTNLLPGLSQQGRRRSREGKASAAQEVPRGPQLWKGFPCAPLYRHPRQCKREWGCLDSNYLYEYHLLECKFIFPFISCLIN